MGFIMLLHARQRFYINIRFYNYTRRFDSSRNLIKISARTGIADLSQSKDSIKMKMSLSAT